MKALDEFLTTKIHRHPTTWLMAVAGGIYGGTQMVLIREAKRAAGQEVQLGSLTLERIVDFAIGAAVQLAFLFAAIWIIAGVLEEINVWLRQAIVLGLYLLANVVAQFL